MKSKPNPFRPFIQLQNLASSGAAMTATIIMLLGLAAGHSQAQTTGFLQTAAGTYDYNLTDNWVGGTINGIWDPSLTILGVQTATFGGDTALTSGLNFSYTGNFDLTLRSSGVADQTITLGGDITVAPVSNRTITIGSATANQGLNVNLGGVTRTFTVTGTKAVSFLNTLSNGDFSVSGNSSTALGGTFKLSRSSGVAPSSDIAVVQNGLLQFDSSTSGINGAIRAQSITLKSGGRLLASGNNGANSTETISGNLVIDGSIGRPRSSSNSIASVTLAPGTKNALLTFNSLQRAANGVGLLRGTSLGTNTIASASASSGNIQITGTAPALVGGGGDVGSTNISIIPWAIGGTTSSDGGSTFVTYTADNGIRPLNIATEFASAFGGSATDNVRLTATADTSIASDTTVNSLILSGQGGSISGPGTLTVTSGAVFMTRTTGTTSPITANLNFGTAEGVIGFTRGDTVSGTVAGSGGLTIHGIRSDENLLFNNSASTYTGDTTILSNAQVVAGFLPFGARTGNVYVYGNLQLAVSGYTGTINGLFGNGIVAYGNSVASTLTFGDNNANATFTGTITANSNLKIVKIGNGAQTLTGAHTWGRGIEVKGGILSSDSLADGGSASGIGNSTSTATNLVINGGTLKYTGAAVSSDRLFTVGAFGGSLDSSGSGAVTLTNTGNNVSAEAANRNGTRTTGSNVVTGVTNFADLVVGARINSGISGIPAGTTITALNPTAGEITLSAQSTANINNGNMSFSTDRKLTLTGSNTGDNTISGVLANSTNSGKLGVTKSGAGKWILGAFNTFNGDTEVQEGTLVLAEPNDMNESSAVRIASTATLALDFEGTDTVARLFIGGVQQPAGTYKASGNLAEGTPLAQLSGTGLLIISDDPVTGDDYATWAANNADGQDPDLDYDNDGTPNGVEYFMGETTPGFTANPGIVGGKVTWPKYPAFSGTYVVQKSTDLSIWTPVTVTDNGDSIEYLLPTGQSEVFVRLKVIPQ